MPNVISGELLRRVRRVCYGKNDWDRFYVKYMIH